MRWRISESISISILGCAVLSGLLVNTSYSQCKNELILSPTHGKPASTFVSGCEVYLFGKYVEPIKGPDGELGYLIEKTDSALTLNGIHYYSPHDPQRKRVRPLSDETKRHGVIFRDAIDEIRRLATAHPSLEKAYYINNVLYTDMPKPYVTASGDTVILQFNLGSARIVCDDVPLVFELKPSQLPSLSEEEWNELYLDRAYHSLASIRPGFIILIGRGYKDWRPLSQAPAMKNAIEKIPAHAKRLYRNIYGEWVYESLSIDEFYFSPTVVADFAEK